MIQGRRRQRGPIMCSAGRAIHYLLQGSSGFFAYVVETHDKGKAIVDDVQIVRDYLDVFPKDFPRVPPERHVTT